LGLLAFEIAALSWHVQRVLKLPSMRDLNVLTAKEAADRLPLNGHVNGTSAATGSGSTATTDGAPAAKRKRKRKINHSIRGGQQHHKSKKTSRANESASASQSERTTAGATVLDSSDEDDFVDARDEEYDSDRAPQQPSHTGDASETSVACYLTFDTVISVMIAFADSVHQPPSHVGAAAPAAGSGSCISIPVSWWIRAEYWI